MIELVFPDHVPIRSRPGIHDTVDVIKRLHLSLPVTQSGDGGHYKKRARDPLLQSNCFKDCYRLEEQRGGRER